jgi:hypothetical protein
MDQFSSPSRQTTKRKRQKKRKEKKGGGGVHMGQPIGPAACAIAHPGRSP